MEQALRFVFYNDRGLRAGWRLAIFLLIFACLTAAFLLASRLISGNRPLGVSSLTAGLVILNDGPTFLLLLFASWIMSRIERRPLGAYGLPVHDAPAISRFISGYIFWGFIPLTVCLLALRVFGAFDFGSTALHGGEILKWGAAWFVAFVLVGLSEEYLLRGYLLYTLADGIGFWPATIVLGVLFGIGHSGNPGETRIGLIATVVFAIFACVTLRLTGNLWLAVGAHAGWDWGQSFFYGVPDSGLTAKGHFLNPSFRGPVWLTGGTVGPEGSVVVLIVWSGLMLVFYLVHRNRKQPALIIEPGTAPPPQAL